MEAMREHEASWKRLVCPVDFPYVWEPAYVLVLQGLSRVEGGCLTWSLFQIMAIGHWFRLGSRLSSNRVTECGTFCPVVGVLRWCFITSIE